MIFASATLTLALLAAQDAGAAPDKTFAVRVANESKPLQFAGAELHAALKAAGFAASESPALEIVVAADRGSLGANAAALPDSLGPEAFAVRAIEGATPKRLVVLGGDARGALAGALELADRLAAGEAPDAIAPLDGKPAHRVRAFRVNLALGSKDGAPAWTFDVDLWERLCDAVARDRFDTLMIFAPDPFAVLATSGSESALFSRVFALARARGLDPVLVATRVDAATKDAVKSVISAQPDLRGVGVASDDPAPSGEERERALREGLLAGIAESKRTDVAAVVGDRGFEPAGVDRALAAAPPPAGAFVLVHYNGDHALSMETPHFFDPGWLAAREPRRFEVLWNLRSDDAIVLPAGDPGFVRRTLEAALAAGPSAGVLVGSSLDDPGPDDVYTEEERKNVPWKYKFEKHWFSRALWGTLAFAPSTPDARFEKLFVRRYGEKAGPRFFAAFVEGSKVLPLVNSFHFSLRATDYYTEGNIGLTNTGLARGFNYRDEKPWHDSFEWIFNHTMDDAQIGILEFALLRLSSDAAAPDATAGRKAVAALANEIGNGAGNCHNASYQLLDEFDKEGGELRAALLDMKALGHYGVSQAQRIRGAMEQALYLSSGDKAIQRRARSFTHNAWGQWKYEFFNTSERYRPTPLGPFGPYLPGANLEDADQDTERVLKLKADRDGFALLAASLGGARPPAGFDFRSVTGWFDFGVPGFDYSPLPLKEGTTVVEAEDLGGAWALAADVAGASGRGVRASNELAPAPSGLVRRLHVTAPGTYGVFVRARRGGGEDRGVLLRVAGKDLGPTHAAPAVPDGLAWEKAGVATLSAGVVAIEVRDAGAGREAVDAIAISNVPGYEPK